MPDPLSHYETFQKQSRVLQKVKMFKQMQSKNLTIQSHILESHLSPCKRCEGHHLKRKQLGYLLSFEFLVNKNFLNVFSVALPFVYNYKSKSPHGIVFVRTTHKFLDYILRICHGRKQNRVGKKGFFEKVWQTG